MVIPTEKHFLSYIKKKSSKQAYAIGRFLYKKKVATIVKHDENRETIVFFVKEFTQFLVSIENYLSLETLSSSCSCQNYSQKKCKHEVAALLVLNDLLSILRSKSNNQSTKKTKPKTKKRKSSEPIHITDVTPISIENIYGQIDETELDGHGNFGGKILGEELGVIAVDISEGYWEHLETAEYYWENDKLYSTCSCEGSHNGMCFHQIAGLVFLVKNKDKDYFIHNNPKKYTKEKQELIKWAGIKEAEFENYYEFDFETKSYFPIGKLAGLINFAQANPLIELPQKEIRQLLPVPIISEEEKNIFYMGFVLSNTNSDRYTEIVPIVGKKLPKGGLKTIKNYYDLRNRSNVQKNTIDNQSLAIISQLNALAFPDEQVQFDEEAKEYFWQFKELMKLLAQHPFVYLRDHHYSPKILKRDINPVSVSDSPAKLFFELSEDGHFMTLQAKLKLGDLSIAIQDYPNIFISAFLILHNQVLYTYEKYDQAVALAQKIEHHPSYLAKMEDIDLFFEQIVQPIAEQFPIKIGDLSTLVTKETMLKAKRKRIYISDMDNYVLFEPAILYGKSKIIKIYRKGDLIEKNEHTIDVLFRDSEKEQEFIQFMASLHPDFPSQTQHDFFFLRYDQLLEKDWFFTFFEKAHEEDIKVFGVKNLKRLKYSPHRANISTHIKSGQDWFDVEINLSFGKEKVTMASLRKAVLKQSKFIELKGGQLGILPEEWLKKLEAYFRLGAVKDGKVQVSKHKFTLIDSLFNDIDDTAILQELAEKRLKIKQFKNIKKVSLSPNITAELRPYQKEGLNWLHFLDDFKWGGILADDMGLGKTVQVLSFLQSVIDKKQSPNLIIVPTTLLFNWRNEIAKFAPAMDYTIHYGPDRAKDWKNLKGSDVIITTYGHIIRDITFLKNQQFAYVILDESQAIKNVLSQRYKAVCLLKAKNRIAMTGTPIENNTFDLFAQMNFLNPGFLGTQAGFKRDYSKPIDANQDVERAQELQKMIAPFILRRTKEQVAKELPPKIEDYIYVNMGKEQQQVYDAYRNKYRDYLLGKIETDGLNKSKMYVLEGLTKLRLICDSPELITDEDFVGESAKIQELIRHINEKTANHKMLVFSQFTKMLALVKIELDKNNIPYEYLDGKCSQKQREASVDNFQTNPDVRVFLISLKAGNTGLNLTAADYVYLLDPWWNPAVEAQAIDRTHRIGQDKHVIAYRMIAKDTVEEKIIKLQEKKRKLASDLIHTDESVMKSLQQADILDLFS